MHKAIFFFKYHEQKSENFGLKKLNFMFNRFNNSLILYWRN